MSLFSVTISRVVPFTVSLELCADFDSLAGNASWETVSLPGSFSSVEYYVDRSVAENASKMEV